MITEEDREWIRFAADEHWAPHGRFRVEPNPLVGCSIWLRRGERWFGGSGIHLAYGGAHAEVNAIRDAGPRRTRGATAYVTLEPCTTTGKTGPCVEALIRAGVKRVVWGVRDPNPAHAGKAAAILRAHGIVAAGPAFRRDPFPDLTAALRRHLASDRPYVIAKWASTLDGKLAVRDGRKTAISGDESRRLVHQLRGRVEAVLTGVGTVLADDPRLDCRLPDGPPDGRPQPAAVVFDSRLRTPLGAALVRRATPGRPLLVYAGKAPARRERTFAARRGVVVTRFARRDGRVDLPRALAHLRAVGARRVLVEAGARLTGALLAGGLVDQVAAIVAPTVLGDPSAPSLVLPGSGPRARIRPTKLFLPRALPVGEDVWIEGYVFDPDRPFA